MSGVEEMCIRASYNADMRDRDGIYDRERLVTCHWVPLRGTSRKHHLQRKGTPELPTVDIKMD